MPSMDDFGDDFGFEEMNLEEKGRGVATNP
jgi:hypothetical protein